MIVRSEPCQASVLARVVTRVNGRDLTHFYLAPRHLAAFQNVTPRSSRSLLSFSDLRGHSGVVARALSSHLGEPDSIPGGVAPEFLHEGILPDDASGRWVFSGISCLPNPFNPVLLHTHLASPLLALPSLSSPLFTPSRTSSKKPAYTDVVKREDQRGLTVPSGLSTGTTCQSRCRSRSAWRGSSVRPCMMRSAAAGAIHSRACTPASTSTTGLPAAPPSHEICIARMSRPSCVLPSDCTRTCRGRLRSVSRMNRAICNNLTTLFLRMSQTTYTYTKAALRGCLHSWRQSLRDFLTVLIIGIKGNVQNVLHKYEQMHQPAIAWTLGSIDESLENSRLFRNPPHYGYGACPHRPQRLHTQVPLKVSINKSLVDSNQSSLRAGMGLPITAAMAFHGNMIQPAVHTVGWGNGRSLRKPADQRNRPAQFPHAKIRERPRRESNPVSSRWEASSLISTSPQPRHFWNQPLKISPPTHDWAILSLYINRLSKFWFTCTPITPNRQRGKLEQLIRSRPRFPRELCRHRGQLLIGCYSFPLYLFGVIGNGEETIRRAFDHSLMIGAGHMGHSTSEVWQTLGISLDTVSRVCANPWSSTEPPLPGKNAAGYNVSMTGITVRWLVRLLTAYRQATLQQITHKFNSGPQRPVSIQTIQYHLLAVMYRSRRPTRVPLLNACHKAQRLCRWQGTSASPNTSSDGSLVPSGFVLKVVNDSAMLLDVICIIHEENHEHLEMSLKYSRMAIQTQHPERYLYQQQDNTPAHPSQIVNEWLDEHSTDFRSPGLNPTEHIWDTVERDVRAIVPPPIDLCALWEAVQLPGIRMAPDSIRWLVESMPRRVTAVIRNRTKYSKGLSESKLCISIVTEAKESCNVRQGNAGIGRVVNLGPADSGAQVVVSRCGYHGSGDLAGYIWEVRRVLGPRRSGVNHRVCGAASSWRRAPAGERDPLGVCRPLNEKDLKVLKTDRQSSSTYIVRMVKEYTLCIQVELALKDGVNDNTPSKHTGQRQHSPHAKIWPTSPGIEPGSSRWETRKHRCSLIFYGRSPHGSTPCVMTSRTHKILDAPRLTENEVIQSFLWEVVSAQPLSAPVHCWIVDGVLECQFSGGPRHVLCGSWLDLLLDIHSLNTGLLSVLIDSCTTYASIIFCLSAFDVQAISDIFEGPASPVFPMAGPSGINCPLASPCAADNPDDPVSERGFKLFDLVHRCRNVSGGITGHSTCSVVSNGDCDAGRRDLARHPRRVRRD
ncbi:hypothetical protein PR048_021694 [Dryococelus australis]|uniref:Uncharacterized protein n=1 Tax=Dryococelus australis TaxID=614101 RepID=A0ABQ9GYZ5_9NEOP|nr:hypothetical protein PR048_021694 [Dryococelus australis]